MRAGKKMNPLISSPRKTVTRLTAALLLACLAISRPGGTTRAATTIIPTNEWVNFYSQASYLNGRPLPVGALVVAYNPRGAQ